jgi:hypothetical protein
MKKIEINKINNWHIAKKTKNIKAKPLISLMVDRSVASKFLVDTLEGREYIGDGSIICLGDSNDIWQQMPKKFLAKYSVIEIDKDGWMLCEPRPDNSVNCVEITKEFQTSDIWISDVKSDFYIIGQWGGQWGEEVNGEKIQRGEYGDFICQNREDPSDVWIVKRKIFINTYNIIG